MASLRAKVDDIIGRLDHVEVVLDDHDRMAVVDQSVQAIKQPIDVGEVQTGRRLVENVQIVFTAFELAKFASKLDALGFAAGEDRRRMAELEVSESEFVQDRDLAGDRRLILEELDAFLNRQIRGPRRCSCPGT